MTDDVEWQVAAMRYLERLGKSEYESQRNAHGKSKKKFKFFPSQYMFDLIECTKKNDEEGFKIRKMLEGRSSSLGV